MASERKLIKAVVARDALAFECQGFTALVAEADPKAPSRLRRAQGRLEKARAKVAALDGKLSGVLSLEEIDTAKMQKLRESVRTFDGIVRDLKDEIGRITVLMAEVHRAGVPQSSAAQTANAISRAIGARMAPYPVGLQRPYDKGMRLLDFLDHIVGESS